MTEYLDQETISRLENRLKTTERKLHAQNFFLVAFFILALINLVFALFFMQRQGTASFDFIATVLTVLEIFFAVTVIGGFWIFRQAAVAKAKETAIEATQPVVTEARSILANAEENAKSIARRAAVNYLDHLKSNSGESSPDAGVDEFMKALDNENGDE